MASALETAIAAYRNEILRAESKATLETVKAYAKVRAELVTRITALSQEIAAEGRSFTVGEALQFDRAQTLLRQVEAQMTALSRGTAPVIEGAQATAVTLGQEHTLGMALVGTMDDPRATAQVVNVWNRLNTGAVEGMVGRLSDGSPLGKVLDGLGSDTSTRMKDALTKAVALGENPRQVAARLSSELDVSGARLLTVTRTEIMGAYRSASLASMAAQGDDVLSGWIWVCALDNSCASCVAQHGTEHPLSETFFASHPNCRCSPAGLVRGVANPITQSGEDWFSKLSEKEQVQVLGPGGAAAYRAGGVRLSDFIQRTDHPEWGPGTRQGSLTSALDSAGSREREAA